MFNINYKKIRYVVSVKKNNKGNNINGTTYPRCKYPREQPIVRTRGYSDIYTCPETGVVKVVNYPMELWGTEILENDKIESDLINIRDDWPDWYLIDVLYY